jgi:hypothetical protein
MQKAEDENMKNKLWALLVVLLLATLTACGGGSEDKDKDPGTDEGGKFDNYKSGEFVEIMESGTYYLDCSAYVTGIETSMKMAVDGADNSIEVSGIGFPVRMLTLDGKMYYMNDEKKVYMMIEGEEVPDPVDSGILDYEGIEFGKNGNGTISDLAGIDDNAYDYEEFNVGTGEDTAVVRYYFKDDNLYAIEVKMGEVGSTMVINQLTKNIPAGLMEMPSGYTLVDATEFF